MCVDEDLIEVPDVVTLDYLYAYVTTVFDRIQSVGSLFVVRSTHLLYTLCQTYLVSHLGVSGWKKWLHLGSCGSTYPVHVISWIWK
jgi:hypothetical protein